MRIIVIVLPIHGVEVDIPVVLVPLPCLSVVVLTQSVKSVIQHVVVISISMDTIQIIRDIKFNLNLNLPAWTVNSVRWGHRRVQPTKPNTHSTHTDCTRFFR